MAKTSRSVEVATTNSVMPPIFNVSIKQESCLYILSWLLVLLADYGFRLVDKGAWDKRKRIAEVLIESIIHEISFAVTIAKAAEGCTIGVVTRASLESDAIAGKEVVVSLEDLLKALKRYTANPHYVVMHSFQKELVLNNELSFLQEAMNAALEHCHWQKVGSENSANMFEATRLFSTDNKRSRLRFFAAMESMQGRSKVITWVTTYSADLTVHDCQQASSILLSEFQRRSEENHG
jgi:hypothetical protein